MPGILAAAVTAGCFGGTLPARELYRLRPLAAPALSAPSQPSGPSAQAGGRPWVLVEPYVTPGLYADPQIVYRVGETSYGTYANREWAIPLATMLGSLTVEALRASPATAGQVSDDPAVLGSGGLIWRATVREFEEVDRGKTVSAAAHLEALLIRAADDSVLWQGAARLEQRVPQPTMAAVVDALSTLAASAITKLVRDAEGAISAYSPQQPQGRAQRR